MLFIWRMSLSGDRRGKPWVLSVDHHARHRSRHVIILIRPISPPQPFFKRTRIDRPTDPTLFPMSSLPIPPPLLFHLPPRLLPHIPHRNLDLLRHNNDGFLLLVRGSRASCVLLPRPQARQDDLLHAGLDAAFVDPGVQPAVDQLGDLGYVLQARAGAHEGADAEVEAVVGQEGEGEGGRRRRGRLLLVLRCAAVAGRGAGGRGVGRQEGYRERAGETHDRDGEGDGEDGGERIGVVKDDFRLDAQGDEIAQVHVHPCLQPRPLGPVCIAIIIIHGMDPAIAQNREFLPETDLRHLDIRQKARFLLPVQDTGQRLQNRVVVMCVVPELRDRLRNQDVKPVQTLGLVGVDIVIRLGEDRSGSQSWRGPQDVGGGAFTVEFMRGGRRGGEGEGAAAVSTGEGAR